MIIELLHPISHGEGQTVFHYSRGVHDLPEARAKAFLALKDGSTGAPIARIPDAPARPPQGKVEPEEGE